MIRPCDTEIVVTMPSVIFYLLEASRATRFPVPSFGREPTWLWAGLQTRPQPRRLAAKRRDRKPGCPGGFQQVKDYRRHSDHDLRIARANHDSTVASGFGLRVLIRCPI